MASTNLISGEINQDRHVFQQLSHLVVQISPVEDQTVLVLSDDRRASQLEHAKLRPIVNCPAPEWV